MSLRQIPSSSYPSTPRRAWWLPHWLVGPAGGFGLLALLALPALARGPSATASQPLVLWGVHQDCAPLADASAAIRLRLENIGEPVQELPAESTPTSCSGEACATLVRDQLQLCHRRVLGADVVKVAGGDTRGRIWLVDLGTAQTRFSEISCHNCDLSELLASGAATLVTAPTAAASAQVMGACDAAAPMVTQGGESTSNIGAPGSALRQIRLTVESTERTSGLAASIRKTLLQSLGQLGYQVAEASRSVDPDDPDGGPLLLQVVILAEAATSASRSSPVQSVTLHASHGAQDKNSAIDCLSTSCDAATLPQMVKQNAGLLLDALTHARRPVEASAPRTAADAACAAWPGPTCNAPLSLQEATRTFTAACHAPDVARTAARPLVHVKTDGCKPPNRKALGLRIAGAALLGLGVAGTAGAAAALSLHSKPAEDVIHPTCTYGALPSVCLWNSRTAGIAGIAASAVGTATGIGLLIASWRVANGAHTQSGETKCASPSR